MPGNQAHFLRLQVRDLLFDLNEILWTRAAEGDFSMMNHVLHPGEYRPATPEELAIWDKLTQPHLYEALVEYVQPAVDREAGDADFYRLIIAESEQRREQEQAIQQIPTEV